jgi:hypothetical protein
MPAGRPPRRPVPATLHPPAAWLMHQYCQLDPDGFRAFTQRMARRHLPVEEQLQAEDDFVNLEYVAGWQSRWAMFDVERVDRPASNQPRRSTHDDSECTTAEAAAELEMSPQHVLRLVKQGVLVGRKVHARSTLITRASVRAFKARRVA